ncbi:MAG: hypothetical protein E7090_07825 [Bacteroidales bacterium]|nr:hypothetical protein [Bacteroidales bacterium]
MGYLDSYADRLNNDSLAESVKKTADSAYQFIESKFNFSEQLTGLLLGNVQSGKTGQMLGLISKLADNGYRLFLVLTTDNVDLQRQTYNRVFKSLPDFTVLSERDTSLFNPNNLVKPLIIVLKKNSSVLRKWGNLLVTSQLGAGLCLCIFDDEADAASLNTLVNKSRTSTINKHLKKIKDSASSSIYFEVTATPQAIVLQTTHSGWKPAFIQYFKPGVDYLGGNFFYSRPISYCIRFTEESELDEIKEDGDTLCPEGLRKSIMSFLVVCGYKKMNGESNCNFMIHPSARIAIHTKFTNYVQEYLNLLQQSTSDTGFDEQLKEAWEDLQQTKPDIPHYEDLKEFVIQILDETLVCVIPLNSKSTICRDVENPDALDLSKGYNIIVGGNTLGRGLTFPNLQTVYYCRTSKTPQADTFWQHSRIFGYDREKELVRIFIPQRLHSLFVALNEANDILIKQIENGLDDIQLLYPEGVRPTRKNVLDNKYLNMIVGGVNMFASYPTSVHTQEINELIEYAAGSEFVDVTADELISILELIVLENSSDFDTNKYVSCIKALREKRPSVKCRLIVRIDRDISKGTGTMLSPTDRLLGDKFNDDIVLTMYRLVGSVDKGWEGKPLWMPNIKFPDGICFYNTLE